MALGRRRASIAGMRADQRQLATRPRPRHRRAAPVARPRPRHRRAAQVARPRTRPWSWPWPWPGMGVTAIGVGLIVLAGLGPLLSGVVDYRVTETLRDQTIGLDAVSLLVVAPLCFAAARLLRRGHPPARGSPWGSAPTRLTCSFSTCSGRTPRPCRATTS